MVFATRTKKIIHFKSVCQKIKTINELPNFDQSQFDFITSFKMGCEIISKGKGLCDNAYYELLSKYANSLSKTGFFLLLDITTKYDRGCYYPQLMNRQVNDLFETKLSTLHCTYSMRYMRQSAWKTASHKKFESAIKRLHPIIAGLHIALLAAVNLP